jgi:protein-tyrosine phosphatase
VCTGNICRSPLAAGLVRTTLARSGIGDQQIAVASAGTAAVVGAGMDPLAEAELRVRGAAPGAFVARQVDRELVERADLVLTAERHHRQFIVQLVPRSLRTAFTMREFARLVIGADGPPDGAGARAAQRDVVAAARARRGRIPATAADDDIPDPYGRSPEVHHEVAVAIAAVVDAVVSALSGAISAR